MQVSAEIRYDADPRTVFAMITDPAFQRAKCEATGSLEHEVRVDARTDGGVVVFSRRTMPTDQVPDFVRSLVGATVHLEETQTWHPVTPEGERTGVIVVQIQGAPVRFTASTALSEDGTGTHQPIEGELKASVPLFGGRIERAAEPAVRAAIRVEQRTGTTWLSTHPHQA